MWPHTQDSLLNYVFYIYTFHCIKYLKQRQGINTKPIEDVHFCNFLQLSSPFFTPTILIWACFYITSILRAGATNPADASGDPYILTLMDDLGWRQNSHTEVCTARKMKKNIYIYVRVLKESLVLMTWIRAAKIPKGSKPGGKDGVKSQWRKKSIIT